jgi:hypothetical protein
VESGTAVAGLGSYLLASRIGPGLILREETVAGHQRSGLGRQGLGASNGHHGIQCLRLDQLPLMRDQLACFVLAVTEVRRFRQQIIHLDQAALLAKCHRQVVVPAGICTYGQIESWRQHEGIVVAVGKQPVILVVVIGIADQAVEDDSSVELPYALRGRFFPEAKLIGEIRI